jgi:hypothetical protein
MTTFSNLAMFTLSKISCPFLSPCPRDWAYNRLSYFLTRRQALRTPPYLKEERKINLIYFDLKKIIIIKKNPSP